MFLSQSCGRKPLLAPIKLNNLISSLTGCSLPKRGVITDNDPLEQEKRLHYLDLVANAIILQNTVDLSQAIQTVSDQGFPVTTELLAGLSPYLTSKIKRYGDYILDLLTKPLPLEEILAIPFKFSDLQTAG